MKDCGETPARCRRAGIVLGLSTAVAVLAACAPPPEEAAPAHPLRVVDTALVQTAAGERRATFSGRARAAEQSVLSFEVGGEVERLSVDVGDRFEAGQLLAQLDDSRYQLALSQAASSETEARANLRERELNYERQRKLIDRGLVSQAQLDSARAALDTARSRYEAARASRRLAERDRQLTSLKAPFAGSVSRRHLEPSERVSANQAVLEVISDRRGFEIMTSVPENLVDRLELKRRHYIALPALEAVDIPVRVRHIGSQPQSSNNYPLVLRLEHPVAGLRSGMTAEVHLSIARPPSAKGQLAVPLTALVYGAGDAAHVLRVSPENRLERVAVRVGALEGTRAMVAGDLSAGDRVVARGVEFVAAGEMVAVLGQGPERYN